MSRFYGHFAAAVGTILMGFLALSFLTGRFMDLGVLGLVGIPIAAVTYALIRVGGGNPSAERIRWLEDRIHSLTASALVSRYKRRYQPEDVLEVVE